MMKRHTYSLLLLIAVILAATPSYAQFGFVQSKTGSRDTPLTLTSNVTAGDIMIAGINIDSALTITAVSGNCSSWVQAPNNYVINTTLVAATDTWVCLSATSTASTTISVTLSSGTTGYEIHAWEISAVGTPAIDAGNNSVNNTGNASATNTSVTTASSHELLFSMLLSNMAFVDVTVPPGWDSVNATHDNVFWDGESSVLLDSGSSAGSKSANWAFSTLADYAQGLVAIKISGGGGGGLTPAQKARGFLHLPWK